MSCDVSLGESLVTSPGLMSTMLLNTRVGWPGRLSRRPRPPPTMTIGHRVAPISLSQLDASETGGMAASSDSAANRAAAMGMPIASLYSARVAA